LLIPGSPISDPIPDPTLLYASCGHPPDAEGPCLAMIVVGQQPNIRR